MSEAADGAGADVGPGPDPEPALAGPKPFRCGQCGAELTYAPGTRALRCAYCGCENRIPQGEGDIQELDFHAYLAEAGAREETVDRLTLKCQACGAESTAAPHVTAKQCPFCDTSIVATAHSTRVLKPRSLLPFKVESRQAQDSYKGWIRGLWFAPNALQKRAKLDVGMAGIYVPFWTYDAQTVCWYTGQRGRHYYVTETRASRNSKGKLVQSRVQVRKTRWSFASGTVWNRFNDVLIPASHSLPRELAMALEPWDLPNLVPYRDEYLSGFRAESYQVDLEQGFEHARQVMEAAIRESVRRDIGGDDQRIMTLKTQHDKVTFKHILLPVWLSAYRYNGKVYRFMVNARTGEVQGERPWSWPKIAAAAMAAAVVGGIALRYWAAFQ